MNRNIQIVAEFLKANKKSPPSSKEKRRRRRGGGSVSGWVARGRQRNGTGISHLGERRERRRSSSSVEEKSGLRAPFCSELMVGVCFV